LDCPCSKGSNTQMIICANPKEQFNSYQSEVEEAVLRVMRGGRYILGKEVELLEHEFAQYIGVSHAIGVANGTDALEISLRALNIGAGDEVITVSHTAVATVAAIESAGAVPVLIDVEPDFYTLNPKQLSEVLTKKTRAVIAVHIYGQAANLDEIKSFCEQNNLVLIEDVSQAHGASWGNHRLGSIGHIACFSCYPTKNLGAIGDAGLITMNDPTLASKVRMIREYGWRDRYVSDIVGRNSRLDELQAAVLRVKLRYLDLDNAKRQSLAKIYSSQLDGPLLLPRIRENSKHVFHLFVVQTDRRSNLIAHLESQDIYPGIHYPVPIHLQPAYKNRIRTAISMAVTEKLATDVMSLPIYPEFNKIERVVDALNAFHEK
jgi:dTDP-4-amino-4,6-dideoxygalactose transaminase